MKKIYTLLLMMMLAVAAHAATDVQLTAYTSYYSGEKDANGDYIYIDGADFTISATIDGSKITFPNFLETGYDFVAYPFDDNTVGCNQTMGTRYTGITLGELGKFTKYFVYNDTDNYGLAFYYEKDEDGVNWLTYYVYLFDEGAIATDVEVIMQLPDDYKPYEVGEDLDATAQKYGSSATSDITVTGVVDADNNVVHISKICGYPYPIDVNYNIEDGTATSTIPSDWVSGYFEVGSTDYYYIRDFYHSAYNASGKNAFGKYLSLYTSMSAGTTEDTYTLLIYLPNDEVNNSTEGTMDLQVYTQYNTKYTSMNVPVKVSENVYTFPEFLSSDLELIVEADKAAGSVNTNFPTGQVKKTFYINDVKFTYATGYSASYSEWGTATDGSDYFDMAFQLYSSSVNWTWVYVYFFPGTFQASSGVNAISVDEANAPVEVFNLNGVKVNADNLTPGLYIRRQGTKASKFIVK